MTRLIMYDERKDAEQVMENGFSLGYFNFRESMIVAKYFRHILGYGDAKTKSRIKEFIKNKDPFFRLETKANMQKIRGILKKSRNKLENKSDPVKLTNKEIEKIKQIEKYRDKKILFSILVLSKLDDGFFYIKRFRDIRKTILYRATNIEIISLLTKLYSEGFIDVFGKKYKILFLDNSNENIICEINESNIYNLNKKFVEIFGKDTFICYSCNNVFERKSHNQKRCKDCSDKIRKEKKKIEAKKYRERKGLIA